MTNLIGRNSELLWNFVFKDFINIQLIPTTLWHPGINYFLFIDEAYGLQKTPVTFPRWYTLKITCTVTKKLRE